MQAMSEKMFFDMYMISQLLMEMFEPNPEKGHKRLCDNHLGTSVESQTMKHNRQVGSARRSAEDGAGRSWSERLPTSRWAQ
jgi:hypothetical protein